MKERSETSNWIFLYSLLTFCLLEFCICMHDFRIRGKLFGVCSEHFSLAYIKHSNVYVLEPWQNNLSNPDAYSQPCQISKIIN